MIELRLAKLLAIKHFELEGLIVLFNFLVILAGDESHGHDSDTEQDAAEEAPAVEVPGVGRRLWGNGLFGSWVRGDRWGRLRGGVSWCLCIVLGLLFGDVIAGGSRVDGRLPFLGVVGSCSIDSGVGDSFADCGGDGSSGVGSSGGGSSVLVGGSCGARTVESYW